MESGKTIDMIVAPQLVILTEKSPFLSTYTPTIFLASAVVASAEATTTRLRSARNTGVLAMEASSGRLAHKKEDAAALGRCGQCTEATGRGRFSYKLMRVPAI